MRKPERIVAAIIAKVLPGAEVRPVLSQSAGEWDFDLIRGKLVSAVEATRATNEHMERLYAAVMREDVGGDRFKRTLARNTWMIAVSASTNIKRLLQRADALLAQLEFEGRKEFDVGDDTENSPTVKLLWDGLRVMYGGIVESGPYTVHQILLPSDQGTLAPDQVVAAIECEAQKEDNRVKLARANTTERHLFVQLDHLAYPAHEAMRACGLPSRPVDLPSEITHVWVASHIGSAHRYLVWRFSALDGWTDVGPVDLGPPTEPPAA